MIKYISLLAILLATSTSVIAQEVAEQRQLVEMPPEMKQLFLKNMRGHMESLDLVIASLAESNLSDAADIAERTMGVGHGNKRQCDEGESHQQHKTAHKKKSFGKYMPSGMKAMGMQLHIAADDFAVIARTGNQGEAYKALRQITASCVACHRAYQVK